MRRQIKSWNKNRKNPPVCYFYTSPKYFFISPNFFQEGSILLPPVIGVDAPVYTLQWEGMVETNEKLYPTSNTTVCLKIA